VPADAIIALATGSDTSCSHAVAAGAAVARWPLAANAADKPAVRSPARTIRAVPADREECLRVSRSDMSASFRGERRMAAAVEDRVNGPVK
jgi:hypothetical protein